MLPFTVHVLNRFTNVLAAGKADVDPTRRLMPLPVRIVLGLTRVSEFLRMRPARP
jgi:hypothetical protein